MEAERTPPSGRETAALVALLRAGGRPPHVYAERVEEAGGALSILEDEHGLLFSRALDEAAEEIAQWTAEGIRPITVLDHDYPQNLRAVHDRPPLLFITGRLQSRDVRAVAVIGSRRASVAGLDRARELTEHLLAAGYTIVSGLAAGIDTIAHTTALDRGGRTIAVIGTGLRHAYPPQNAALQRRIPTDGAVISQFWPEVGPARHNFPLRNAVMSGMALATMIVEATHTSGARTQARAALAHGRPVLLAAALLAQPWARELAARSGVHVIRSLAELDDILGELASTDPLVA